MPGTALELETPVLRVTDDTAFTRHIEDGVLTGFGWFHNQWIGDSSCVKELGVHLHDTSVSPTSIEALHDERLIPEAHKSCLHVHQQTLFS